MATLGLAMHIYASLETSRKFGEVLRTNTTIDPANPPIVVKKELQRGLVIFQNVGGQAEHTPSPGFTNYEDVLEEISDSLRWIKWTGTSCIVMGLGLTIAALGRYVFST